jgi:RNA polymerase sigma-70 factor (ECF subfamily)
MTDRSGFADIVKEYGPMIARIASTYEVNPHLAEELGQDILLGVWRSLGSFRGDCSLKTFIGRIATNMAVTHVTRALRQPRTAELDEELRSPQPSPEASAMETNERTRLEAAIRALPLKYRQPAMLTLEGFSPTEIAGVLGLEANVVSTLLTRAKDRLRAALFGEGSP